MVISDSLVTVASGSCKALGRRDVMGRPIHIAAGVAALALLALGGTALGHGQGSKTASNPIRLADATMIVEVNATDGDAGLQVFLDGEPWRSMRITSPDGRTILAVKATGRLRNFGLTELFSESSEPPFDEFPLRRFRALFPEGRYSFVGTTVEGERLVGRARLTHDIPHGPEIVSPADGAAVAPENVVASWKPVTTPAGIRIAGYRAIVTREDPLRVFSVDLPASVHSVTVPPQFLEAGTEYKLEVQAIEANGNQTLTEIMFVVT
jgi:Fibronectin type III domain